MADAIDKINFKQPHYETGETGWFGVEKNKIKGQSFIRKNHFPILNEAVNKYNTWFKLTGKI